MVMINTSIYTDIHTHQDKDNQQHNNNTTATNITKTNKTMNITKQRSSTWPSSSTATPREPRASGARPPSL